jgi:hypothetical protein
MGLKTFDSNEVTLSVAGRVINSGFADGDFVKVSFKSDDWTSKAGTDGEVTRSKNNDKRCDMSIMLMQTSDGNDLLNQIRSTDMAAPNGAGVGQVILRDQFGRTLIRGQGWIVKPPEVTRGREVGTNEWKLEVIASEFTIGGSSSVGV